MSCVPGIGGQPSAAPSRTHGLILRGGIQFFYNWEFTKKKTVLFAYVINDPKDEFLYFSHFNLMKTGAIQDTSLAWTLLRAILKTSLKPFKAVALACTFARVSVHEAIVVGPWSVYMINLVFFRGHNSFQELFRVFGYS